MGRNRKRGREEEEREREADEIGRKKCTLGLPVVVEGREERMKGGREEQWESGEERTNGILF